MLYKQVFHNKLYSEVRHLLPRIKCLQPFELYSSSANSHFGKTDLLNKKETLERKISAEDVNLFSKLTGDFNTVHSSPENKPSIVHGALLNGIVSGVIGTRLPGNGTIVVSQTFRFPNPCYVGETIVVTVKIVDVRKILTCTYNIVNKQSKALVMEGSAKLVFHRPE